MTAVVILFSRPLVIIIIIHNIKLLTYKALQNGVHFKQKLTVHSNSENRCKYLVNFRLFKVIWAK